MDLDRLYLDFNATSPLSASVTQWLKSGDLIFANPSSQHSDGKAARKTINESRSVVYSAFKKTEKETRLFFHSGATEGLFTVAWSMAEVARATGKKLLICFSGTDHPAVSTLADRYWGEHVTFHRLSLKSDLSYDHEVNVRELKAIKTNNPDLLVLYHHLWVHNETGLVSPLEELAAFRQIPGLYLHIDAVQAPGKIPEWRDLPEGDFWTFSGHKFGALKGIGFTFVREGVPFHALMSGGGQQQGLRGGTENPQGVKTVALALGDLLDVDPGRVRGQKEELEKFMSQELQGLGELVTPLNRNSNTIYFFLYKLPSDLGLALFDLNGLMISAGSACSSGTARPSAVLTQLGKHEVAKNGLRLSLGFQVDEELLHRVKARLGPIFNKLRS